MFYTDYSNQRTKKGELMDKYTPLQKVDYAPTRRADDDLNAANLAYRWFTVLGCLVAIFAAWSIVWLLTEAVFL